MDDARLRRALRLVLVSDGRGDLARLDRLVGAAIEGGVRGVQVREPAAADAALAPLLAAWRARLDAVGGLLIVNERHGLVGEGLAHGVHLKAGPARIAASRARLPPESLVGASAHDAKELHAARGADWLVLAPVLATPSKPTAVPLGVAAARALVALTTSPVLWLGGFTATTLAALPPGTLPCGFAALGALAIDDAAATARAVALVRAVDAILGPP
jgi:thiamine-phosphate diphosphorylase